MAANCAGRTEIPTDGFEQLLRALRSTVGKGANVPASAVAPYQPRPDLERKLFVRRMAHAERAEALQPGECFVAGQARSEIGNAPGARTCLGRVREVRRAGRELVRQGSAHERS